ncbi:hypothetical protein RYX36_022261, partial [Vicia faba]
RLQNNQLGGTLLVLQNLALQELNIKNNFIPTTFGLPVNINIYRIGDLCFYDVVLISKIQHVNIANLVGYCAECNQRLLIYKYCNNGTLQDALHGDDEYCIKFPWIEHIKVALGAGALE